MPIPLNHVQIVNQCMFEMGRLAIVQSTDDPWALMISQRIPNDIPYLLERDNWNFALKYISQTTPDVYNPSPDWLYAFTLPPDWLRVANMRTELAYTIMGNQMLVNENFIQYYYVANVLDITTLPYFFQKLLVFYICSRVAKPLTQDLELQRDMQTAFDRELSTARQQNAFAIPVWPSPYNPYDRGYGPGTTSGGR